MNTHSTINTTTTILHAHNNFFFTFIKHRFTSIIVINYEPCWLPKKPSNNNVAAIISPTSQPKLTNSDIFSQPPASSLPLPPSPRPNTAPSLKSPVQSKFIRDLIAVSQEIFANPENPKHLTSTKSQLTPAQKQFSRWFKNILFVAAMKGSNKNDLSSSTKQNHPGTPLIFFQTIVCTRFSRMKSSTTLAFPVTIFFFVVRHLRRELR